jgi:competence protein ComEC
MRPDQHISVGFSASASVGEAVSGLERPLVPLTATFFLGIALQYVLELPPLPWTLAASVALLLSAGIWWFGSGRLFSLFVLLTFACLGGQAMAQARFGQPENHLGRIPEAYLDSSIPLEGWVATPPDPRPAEVRDTSDPERTRFVVEVTRLRLGERWVVTVGQARLTVLGEPVEVFYGDEVRGSFRLRHPRRFENPGAFDYPAYLATQGIFLEGWTREPVETVHASRGSRIFAFVFRLRRLLLQRLDGAMPAQEAGLLKATVLGDRSGLSPEMNQAFLESGTYHILAISGLNVSLLAGTLFGLFRLFRASPRLAAFASAILVTLYAALAGGSASVIRATVMADTYLLAVILDRRGDLLNTVALSALALLWWNPRFLFDVGFQLTFLATLGIVLVLPRCGHALERLPRPIRWVLESVIVTLAATLMTLPVLAAAFNRVAPVGILANIPIVPLSGLITASGTAASAFFLATPTGLPWLNDVNGWLVDLLFAMARWFASWPWSTARMYTPTAGMLVAYYGVVAACLMLNRVDVGASRQIRRNRFASWLAGACGLLLVAQVLVKLYLPEGAPTVRLTLLDVGEGEAILLELPGKRRMLVDAGGVPGGRFDVGAHVVAPFLLHEWIGHLDVLVLSHAHEDHIGGVPAILRGFSVGEVWSADAAAASITLLWIQEYLRHRRIPLRMVSAESPVLRWGEATIEALNPPGRRSQDSVGGGVFESRYGDASLVLRISIGNHAAILTGDIEKAGEETLLHRPEGIRAQVLKVPHHGSRSSSGTAFIEAVRPDVALVSAGHRNGFRHPHPEIVERYQRLGVRLLRTDRDGAITVELTRQGMRAWGRREGSTGVGDQGSEAGVRGR